MVKKDETGRFAQINLDQFQIKFAMVQLNIVLQRVIYLYNNIASS
jgi:hypothetical protein